MFIKSNIPVKNTIDLPEMNKYINFNVYVYLLCAKLMFENSYRHNCLSNSSFYK